MLDQMDDRRIEAVFRALRGRKAWRHVDLATRARVSPTVIGRIERGSIEAIPFAKLRRVAESVGARFEATIRWSGADLGRLLDARHAAMHEAVANLLASLDGWEFEPEVSFSIYGERGIIDVLAWHPGRRALLVIELKTEIVDVSDLLGSMDRRRRLSRQIARSRRWDPIEVSTWVVVAESRTNRRAVSSHARVLRSKLPLDGRGIARWLRDPVGRVDALSFLPNRHPVALGRPTAPVRRVSRRSQRPSRA
jgi:transcriptional regulator with XRE-family HTH domain